ncbi:glycerol kinase [Rhodospira trueperi]|uniref:Glycerol kinase n=1 Tax=Rhodospira trueperi TaxID=69960 RepID=A0A1G7DG35_9PROT|nr:glycerol kinase [Rhodospira trueperi]
MDSWLLWSLTGGAVHATDATNAGRTLLFDIRTQRWDGDLLALFDIPRALLPEVIDNAADFGTTRPDLLGGAIRITGMAGDQHAAVVGQGCFAPGMIKSTCGTGAFVLLTMGETFVESRNRLLTTLACRLDGRPVGARSRRVLRSSWRSPCWPPLDCCVAPIPARRPAGGAIRAINAVR